MWLSEQILYCLAKHLQSSEMAHSQEMKEARSDSLKYNTFRLRQIDHVLAAAQRYGIDIRNKIVLDLGCSNGAMTVGYLHHGASEVVGVDIDAEAIKQATASHSLPGVSFQHCGLTTLPLAGGHFDVIICYDVFEHVAHPAAILEECHRILKARGKLFIGTWGWYHPFAPHLWSTMPVPWAHLFVSERTLLKACRKVYDSSWYVPNRNEMDESGQKLPGRYENKAISKEYLNKLLIRDYESLFKKSRFQYRLFPHHFGSKYARWTRIFLKTPWIREFITSYIWVVLTKPEE